MRKLKIYPECVMDNNVLYPSLFEDDYITRSLGTIVSQPDVALTELVANAWDAGATEVKVFIPDKHGEVLYVEDNGLGMSESDFQNRWMKLRYDRVKHQGKKVVFPKGIELTRFAYGKNGVGRHGLLCFNSNYRVITKQGGKQIEFTVSTENSDSPLAAINKIESKVEGHGTRLEVNVSHNLPSVESIREILSTRFLHDPNFKIAINHVTLDLEDLDSLIDAKDLNVAGTDITLKAYFIDTTKAARKSIFQGVAFWQAGRLVGEPSWNLGNIMILDGRTQLAKRYTCIIKSDSLADYVKEDWTGFKQASEMDAVYRCVEGFVNSNLVSVSTTTTAIMTENLRSDIKEQLMKSNPLVQQEVREIVNSIVRETPHIRQESIDTAVSVVINIEKSKNGHELLKKLAELQPDDIDGLNQLLSKWSVKDALVVLNEIDRRISIIEAIKKLSSDKKTDELHVLHPMITEARWLFGPEYESSEYIFNSQIKTAVTKLFKDSGIIPEYTNPKKRPDLIALPNSSISFTGVEDYTGESGLSNVSKLLIIELKKGGFEIKREERNQAQGYVEDLIKSNTLNNCHITSFVVGDTIASNIEVKTEVGSNGIVYVTDYARLVDTAFRRMFGLRQKLAEKYDDIPGMDLYKESMLNL